MKFHAWDSYHSGNPTLLCVTGSRNMGTAVSVSGSGATSEPHVATQSGLHRPEGPLVQRGTPAPQNIWRSCTSLQPQLLFCLAPWSIPMTDTGNIILSRASVLFNVSLHSLRIKTNRNYLSPAELFLYLSAYFSSLFGSEVEIYFQGIHLRAYVVCVHNTFVISSSAFS